MSTADGGRDEREVLRGRPHSGATGGELHRLARGAEPAPAEEEAAPAREPRHDGQAPVVGLVGGLEPEEGAAVHRGYLGPASCPNGESTRSATASAVSNQRSATIASIDRSQALTNASWSAYRARSSSSDNGVIEPVTGLHVQRGAYRAVGTSSHGVRSPPRALPYSSRATPSGASGSRV